MGRNGLHRHAQVEEGGGRAGRNRSLQHICASEWKGGVIRNVPALHG